ncbi:MAG: T9SS type A sorting domain-containing protein [Ignavibacteriales bacterium]|nr:MAG: T9SS type A sorting domain-containing protein [Ignavibacteriales bacterium]
MKKLKSVLIVVILFVLSSQSKAQVDPDTAMKASIDRFSVGTGMLFVRDTTNNLPGPNAPIDFDQGPFITKGLGKNGELVSYYNFDVQPTQPAPIYVLFREGETSPVEGQLNIVGVIPGDAGYNDFWRVNFVTVPSNYVANTVTKVSEITAGSYPIDTKDIIVNCPIVPFGSTALLRYNEMEDPGLTRGWYETQVVYYFNFSEKALMVTGTGMVPVSPIYVTFNINPGEPGGGPPSGFKSDGTGRTHNVPATLPEDDSYSPLWVVNIYDNADFDMVHDLASAQMANILAAGAAIVNCPIVLNESATSVEETGEGIPENFELGQNFPNPFNPSTTIKFSLPSNEFVSLKIFNSIGQEVSELVNQTLPAGSYSINFDAENLSSGIYFYTLSSNNFKSTKKMLLLK